MPLRDIVIIGLVLFLGLVALRRPWVGVMSWTWISIMNPHRYTWAFAYLAPVAMIAAVTTLIGLLLTRDRRSPFQGAPVWWLFAFTLWMTLSWLMGYNPESDYYLWDRAIKIYFMSFVALMLLYTKQHLLTFAWVTVGSIALLSAKGGLFTILTGGSYLVWGPEGSFIADNNHFALAVIVAMPMLHFLQMQLNRPWMRNSISAIILLSVASALGSHSRGAILALVAMGVVFWWRSSHKGLISLLLLVVFVAILPIMPESWWERMSSIADYEQDASAMGRINAWYVAWDVAKNNFFGGGMSYQYQFFFSSYGRFETYVRAAHSIYFQILGNHGFVGLFLYLMIWISAYRTASWLRKNSSDIPEAKWTRDLGAMAQVSLVGFAVGGAFLSMPYFDLPYNVMILLVLARKWVLDRAWETDPPVKNFFTDFFQSSKANYRQMS